MKIQASRKYKSLMPFVADNLPDFIVITGKNGSGKTHLLSAIADSYGNVVSTPYIVIDPAPKRIQVEGLNSVNIGTASKEVWISTVNRLFNGPVVHVKRHLQLLEYLTENDLIEIAKNSNRSGLVSSDNAYRILLLRSLQRMGLIPNETPLSPSTEIDLPDIEKAFYSDFLDPVIIRTFKLLKDIERITNVSVESLEIEHTFDFPIQDLWVDENDLFSSKIELIFYSYAKKRKDNFRLYFEKKNEGSENDSVDDSTFIKESVPPWDIINQILSDHNLDFAFKEIRLNKFSDDLSADPIIYKISSNEEIAANSLSSGENVIINLILKLFTTNYYKDSAISYPDIVLLDEPDAHLHPEMAKILLDVIQQTFVRKLGVKVIMTTHSPSTIALCPEESIYEMRNDQNSGIIKISKDDALNLLTDFIPTLSINYKNHRQVFTESPRDCDYYQLLFSRHSQEKPMHHPLYFLSNGNGKGNCDEVKRMAKGFMESGNNNVFGIIDLDHDRQSENNVFIHENRYSLENFLCDPIYLTAVLLDLKGNPCNIRTRLGIDEYYNYYGLVYRADNNEVQKIADTFFAHYNDNNPRSTFDLEDKCKVEYYSGVTINYPKMFLSMNGHDLIQKIYRLYPPLKERYPNETDLLPVLNTAMIKLYPLIPIESIQLIEKIGEPKTKKHS